jgi:oxygen-independent coproporphyrinogen-3 oxidase
MRRDHFFQLIEKYHSPAGRYNYYPRISGWSNELSNDQWRLEVKEYSGPLDLYIHIPFCEKFCHFCGCNVKIAQKLESQNKYLDKLVTEWKSYDKPTSDIRNIFIGGGTPNSLSIEQFKFLFAGLGLEDNFSDQVNLSIEADPRKINKETFKLLKSFGLNSISLGLQDLSQDVLNIIGRPTQLEEVYENLAFLKELEIETISVDLLYGLAGQSDESLSNLKYLLEKNLINSVSLYPFANVPWFKDFYPLWEEKKPTVLEKYEHYFQMASILEEFKFIPVSFGHFFKKNSAMDKAFEASELRRTIMGHSANRSELLIGLGVSAISSSKNYLKQNSKIYENYIFQREFFDRSHIRSQMEVDLENLFENLSTKKQISCPKESYSELLEDGLVKEVDQNIEVTKVGRHFIQHIAKHIEKYFVK